MHLHAHRLAGLGVAHHQLRLRLVLVAPRFRAPLILLLLAAWRHCGFCHLREQRRAQERRDQGRLAGLRRVALRERQQDAVGAVVPAARPQHVLRAEAAPHEAGLRQGLQQRALKFRHALQGLDRQEVASAELIPLVALGRQAVPLAVGRQDSHVVRWSDRIHDHLVRELALRFVRFLPALEGRQEGVARRQCGGHRQRGVRGRGAKGRPVEHEFSQPGFQRKVCQMVAKGREALAAGAQLQLQGAQTHQLLHGLGHEGRVRRLQEPSADRRGLAAGVALVQACRMDPQDQLLQGRPLHLRRLVVIDEGVVPELRQPHVDTQPRRHATGAAPALAGVGAGDDGVVERRHASDGVVAHLLHAASVNHVADVVDGDRGLSNIRGDDYLPHARGRLLEDLLLVICRETTVERHHP
mmetsp:Transcript_43638/g.124818  ORF Transcript_43638/g.124818 Transcript_43638/m.124818 type:complete len:412 (+) Transcript_43638:1759-2994(+)